MSDTERLGEPESVGTEPDVKSLTPNEAPLIVTHSSLRIKTDVDVKPLLPADLVNNESDDDLHGSISSPEGFSEQDKVKSDEQSDESDDGKGRRKRDKGKKKSGRWSLGKGAAKKSSNSKVRVVSEEPLSKDSGPLGESSKLRVHSETQRLFREAEIRLPEYRPKQFKRFSDFRQSLHGPSLVDSQTSGEAVTSVSAPILTPAENQGTSGDSTNSVDTGISGSVPLSLASDATVQSDSSANVHVGDQVSCEAHVSTTVSQQSRAMRLLSLLPAALPPLNRQTAVDDGFVDLGESMLPTEPFIVTPADRLLARLKEHTRTPIVRKERGPVEYTVLTKAVDEESGSGQLRLESVTHAPTEPPEAEGLLHSSNSQRRKFWKQHRETLKEQMRQKRLEQYEARMKEQGLVESQTQCKTSTGDKALSDDDAEWSEGQEEIDDEELSTDESESSSSDSLTEAEDETEDEDDVPVTSSRSKRSCAFADDEAEESEHDADSETGDNENNDDFDSESNVEVRSVSSKSVDSDNMNRPDQHSIGCRSGALGQPRNERHSRFDKLMDLDDFTDLPGHTTEVVEETISAGNYRLNSTRRPQGSLGPGDVDLFTSDYSTILDRTANATSVLASTRLDNTILADRLKPMGKGVGPEASIHSQWNDTPYELLYSQKIISQPSLSKEQSLSTETTITGSVATPRLSQPDTVILSQMSACDPGPNSTVLLTSTCADSILDSQAEHCRRRQLFSDSQLDEKESTSQLTYTQGSKITNGKQRRAFDGATNRTGHAETHSSGLDDTVPVESSSTSQDSQQVHVNRHELFASSKQSFNKMSLDGQNLEEKDSQLDHDKRRQLFESSELLSTSYPDHKSPAGRNTPYDVSREHCAPLSQSLFSEPSITRGGTAPPLSTGDEFRDLTWNESNVRSPLSSMDSQASQAQHDLHRALFSETQTNLLNDADIPQISHSQAETATNAACRQTDSISTPPENMIADHASLDEKTTVDSEEKLKKTELIDSPNQLSQTRMRRRVVLLEDDEDEDGDDFEDKFKFPTKLRSLPGLNAIAKFEENENKLENAKHKPDTTSDTDKKELTIVGDVSYIEDEDDDVDDQGVNSAPQSVQSKEDESADDEVPDNEDESDDAESVEDEYDTASGDTEEASDEEVAQALALKQNMPESSEQNLKRMRKKFRVDDFLDEEAELSGDENERAFYMDDEDDDGDDEDLTDLQVDDDDPNLPSTGRLRRQVERVHNRLQADQDQRELRFLKELYLEDGDLYAEDGKMRERRFRWRGLENDDPLVDASGVMDGDDTDGGSEDDDTAAAVSRFGPMDRWLQSAPRGSQGPSIVPVEVDGETRSTDVDLDNMPNPGDDPVLTVSEETENRQEDSNSDDEKENRPTQQENDSLSVLSLGRKAVLKAQTSEAQIVIQTVSNRKTVANKASSPKPVNPSNVATIARFFSKQTSLLTSSSSCSQLSGRNTVDYISPFHPTNVGDSRPKLSKCGSLLNRLPVSSMSKSTMPSRPSFVGTADVDSDVVVVPEDSDLSSVIGVTAGGRRNSTGHFFGLRNKVGMSCFNILSQPESGTNGSRVTNQNLPFKTPPFDTGKRASCEPIPVNIKRQRSASVFSALM
ncbi:hypothetical protein D915_007615 [Fasciola hepatica]|uniref:Claspin n=1 Tax=Fasciola hepatica TaxID=6192 RepID=A0A4E0RVI7_FASHE|nr:hypothetical protein D915_007615 [Fasciola hepatica]